MTGVVRGFGVRSRRPPGRRSRGVLGAGDGQWLAGLTATSRARSARRWRPASGAPDHPGGPHLGWAGERDSRPAAGGAGRRRRDRRVQGGRAAAALTETGHDVRVVPTAGALRFVGEPTWAALSGPSGAHRGLGRRATRCRTCGSAGRRTWSWSRRRPPTCSPGPRTGWPTTCSPTSCSPPAARCCWRRPCTPRCGSTRPPGPTWPPCASAASSSSTRPVGRLTGADTGRGRLPEPGRPGRAVPAAAGPRRAPAAGSGRPPGAGHRRRHPGGARPGALPRQPVQRPAGVRAGAGRRGPRRRGDGGVRERRAARPDRRRGAAGRAPRPSCGTSRWSPPRTRTWW